MYQPYDIKLYTILHVHVHIKSLQPNIKVNVSVCLQSLFENKIS